MSKAKSESITVPPATYDHLNALRVEFDGKHESLRVELEGKIEKKMSAIYTIAIASIASAILVPFFCWIFRNISNTNERVARAENKIETIEKALPQQVASQLPAKNTSRGWLK